ADFVREEARVVRAADPGRKILVNCWSEDQRIASAPWTDGDYDVRNALEIGDLLGLDVYPHVPVAPGEQLDATNRVETLPVRDLARARALGKDAWIIEAQAEGWGSYEPTPDDVRALVRLEAQQGFRTITLWGFESWYEQKVKAHDERLWRVAQELAAELLGRAPLSPAPAMPPLGDPADEPGVGPVLGVVEKVLGAIHAIVSWL